MFPTCICGANKDPPLFSQTRKTLRMCTHWEGKITCPHKSRELLTLKSQHEQKGRKPAGQRNETFSIPHFFSKRKRSVDKAQIRNWTKEKDSLHPRGNKNGVDKWNWFSRTINKPSTLSPFILKIQKQSIQKRKRGKKRSRVEETPEFNSLTILKRLGDSHLYKNPFTIPSRKWELYP